MFIQDPRDTMDTRTRNFDSAWWWYNIKLFFGCILFVSVFMVAILTFAYGI